MNALLEAAIELKARLAARLRLHDYITYTNGNYKTSAFSEAVCLELDKFIDDVNAGKRPILMLQAPPQHGKSEIVSRKLPAHILGKFPDWRIAAASYNTELASAMGQDVRRNLDSPDHKTLFKNSGIPRGKYDSDRIGQFNAPGGSGGYISVGIGSGLTGRPVDIGIIDDPTKDQEEAISPVTKQKHWDWYQSVFSTRLSENSGQIIMATSWAEDDLPGRIAAEFADNPRFRHLRFPAINLLDEVGYDPDLPQGALVPELKSLGFLYEQKALLSDYWWAAIYQQRPRAQGGNLFKDEFVVHYFRKDLPKKFDKVVNSWDCTFKDTDGTDFVVGSVWGRSGANCYLLDLVRARMTFSVTVTEVKALRYKWPQTREILIEDKANGPAVIDVLKGTVPGIIPIEPDGSKLARAHAIASYWEARNIYIPDPSEAPWVKAYIAEMTAFPAGAHDDQVDSTTQAVRRLYPVHGRLNISKAAINRARRVG